MFNFVVFKLCPNIAFDLIICILHPFEKCYRLGRFDQGSESEHCTHFYISENNADNNGKWKPAIVEQLNDILFVFFKYLWPIGQTTKDKFHRSVCCLLSKRETERALMCIIEIPQF